MRRIAIITTEDTGCYECDYSHIVTSITDWKEVTDAEFDILSRASQKSHSYNSKIPQFKVIERPVDEAGFILKTIDEYQALIKKEEAKAAEDKRKRAEAAARRKDEAASKKIEKLKKQLEQLEAAEK